MRASKVYRGRHAKKIITEERVLHWLVYFGLFVTYLAMLRAIFR